MNRFCRQIRCRAFAVFVLMSALINGSAVLVSRVPDLWSVGTSAFTADKFGCKNIYTDVAAFRALPPFHFRLHCIENLRRDDRRVAVFHIILRNLPIILFRFLGEIIGLKVFCRSASPLYFSFVRILLTVDAVHFSLPPGVGIWRAVSSLPIPCGVNPERKSL